MFTILFTYTHALWRMSCNNCYRPPNILLAKYCMLLLWTHFNLADLTYFTFISMYLCVDLTVA